MSEPSKEALEKGREIAHWWEWSSDASTCTEENHARKIAAAIQAEMDANPLRLTVEEIDGLLDRWDKTAPDIQRGIVVKFATLAKGSSIWLHERDTLQAFKDWTHAWLDAHGVPGDPDTEKNKATGCRIGGRMEWLWARRNELLDGCKAALSKYGPNDGCSLTTQLSDAITKAEPTP